MHIIDDLLGLTHAKKKKGQRKGGASARREAGKALLRLPVNLNNLVYAQTLESVTAAGKNVTGAATDLSDIWNKTKLTNAKTRLLDAQAKAATASTGPTVQAFGSPLKALFGSKSCLEIFGTFLSTAQVIIAAIDVVYNEAELAKIGIRIAEGIEAQVGLSAPAKFSNHVRLFVKHHINYIPDSQKGQHYFFLYHPDTDWHPHFADALEESPLPDELIAMSENLDALVTYMRFFRWHLKRRAKKERVQLQDSVFHLLIPAYRPMFLKAALKFPDLGMFVIHGDIHNSKPYVWFNLPRLTTYPGPFLALSGIGNITRKPTKWKNPVQGTALAGEAGVTGYGAWYVGAAVATPLLATAASSVVVVSGIYAMYKTYQGIESWLGEEVPRLLGEPDLEAERELDDARADTRSIGSNEAIFGNSETEYSDDGGRFRKNRRTKHVRMKKNYDLEDHTKEKTRGRSRRR